MFLNHYQDNAALSSNSADKYTYQIHCKADEVQFVVHGAMERP